MAITIENAPLERKLEELGARQTIPVRKTTMAEAILKAAVADDRGKPIEKWKERSRRFAKVSAA